MKVISSSSCSCNPSTTAINGSSSCTEKLKTLILQHIPSLLTTNFITPTHPPYDVERVFVNSTLERVIEDEEGLQLLTESLALFGCLLLLMEHYMSGFLGEKLLVVHLRHDRCFDAHNLEAMYLLCRAHLTNTSGSVRQVQSSRTTSNLRRSSHGSLGGSAGSVKDDAEDLRIAVDMKT